MTKYYGFWYGAFPTLFLFAWNTNINCNVVHNKFFWQIFIVFQGNIFHILNPLFIWLKWCASTRWLSSLCPKRNSDQMTNRKTHPTLWDLSWPSFDPFRSTFNPDHFGPWEMYQNVWIEMDQKLFPKSFQWIQNFGLSIFGSGVSCI